MRKNIKMNFLRNGNFTRWPLGETFNSVVSDSVITSGWHVRYNANVTVPANGAAYNITASDSLPAGVSGAKSLKVATATAATSAPAGDFLFVQQCVEGYDMAKLSGKNIVLSFWAKLPAGTYAVAFRNAGNGTTPDASYVVPFTVAAADANTWKKHVVPLLLSSPSGTWNYTNGVGLAIAFVLVSGSNFQTTGSAWVAGNYLATAAQSNFAGTQGNEFYLAQVQLEEGFAVSPFIAEPEAVNITRCLRYLERLGGVAYTPFATGLFDSATRLLLPLSYIPKRAAPTITFASAAGYRILSSAGSAAALTVGADYISESRAFVTVGTSGATPGDAAMLDAAAAGSSITINAELII
jgi:hypothetical protein